MIEIIVGARWREVNSGAVLARPSALILVDTDVLIWYLRGYLRAAQKLDLLAEPAL